MITLLLLILIVIILNTNIVKEGFNTCSKIYSKNLLLLNSQPKVASLSGYENLKVLYEDFNKEKKNV
jgi:hypothetical protein|tara:strand:- start:2395 stop:2595 length:201 start_codon:yes stop_codon:yes gene_type:complete